MGLMRSRKHVSTQQGPPVAHNTNTMQSESRSILDKFKNVFDALMYMLQAICQLLLSLGTKQTKLKGLLRLGNTGGASEVKSFYH